MCFRLFLCSDILLQCVINLALIAFATFAFGVKVALNALQRTLSNFAKSCILSCLSQFDDKIGVTKLVFKLKALKAKIKGVFGRSYCYYGNVICKKQDDCNL